ncbi:hypothetical protein G9A89_011065 [Geosiphon pyriformis]|nr:hypothetical protein G9A89_011065 [Geosiphon pyriformis]
MTYRVIEFYSGIGGMRYAFDLSGYSGTITAAFDINTTANHVYLHNFGSDAPVKQRNIEALPLAYYDTLKADIWLMSPPCQPYTRIGLRHGSADIRSRSFLYLINLLSEMKNPPKYVLIENVKGFEDSDTHTTLTKKLQECQYDYQEFFISPLQLGIPNSRLRYYMLAKRWPFLDQTPLPSNQNVKSESDYRINRNNFCTPVVQIKRLEEFLEVELCDNVIEQRYSIPKKILLKYGKLFDIVKPSSTHSCCFTKGYHHYVEATGSILQMAEEVDTTQVFQEATSSSSIDCFSPLRLRYFTEREVASLMGFPKEFAFPDSISLKQRYRLLGNSINVRVVAELIRYLLFDQ